MSCLRSREEKKTMTRQYTDLLEHKITIQCFLQDTLTSHDYNVRIENTKFPKLKPISIQ